MFHGVFASSLCLSCFSIVTFEVTVSGCDKKVSPNPVSGQKKSRDALHRGCCRAVLKETMQPMSEPVLDPSSDLDGLLEAGTKTSAVHVTVGETTEAGQSTTMEEAFLEERGQNKRSKLDSSLLEKVGGLDERQREELLRHLSKSQKRPGEGSAAAAAAAAPAATADAPLSYEQVILCSEMHSDERTTRASHGFARLRRDGSN
jgi:hypothetical protein